MEHVLLETYPLLLVSQSVRSEAISWKSSPSYTDVASWDAHTGRLAAQTLNAECVWKQPGWRHHRGDYRWEDGPHPSPPPQPSSESHTGHSSHYQPLVSWSIPAALGSKSSRHKIYDAWIVINLRKLIKLTDFNQDYVTMCRLLVITNT